MISLFTFLLINRQGMKVSRRTPPAGFGIALVTALPMMTLDFFGIVDSPPMAQGFQKEHAARSNLLVGSLVFPVVTKYNYFNMITSL